MSNLHNLLEIWQVSQQTCCWATSQISRHCACCSTQSHGFENSQDLMDILHMVRQVHCCEKLQMVSLTKTYGHTRFCEISDRWSILFWCSSVYLVFFLTWYMSAYVSIACNLDIQMYFLEAIMVIYWCLVVETMLWLFWRRASMGCVTPPGPPWSIYKSDVERHFLKFWVETAKWPWSSRSVTAIFSTTRE